MKDYGHRARTRAASIMGLLSAAAMPVAAASAEVVTVQFSGQVEAVLESTGAGLVDAFPLNPEVNGYLRFDNSTPLTESPDAGVGRFSNAVTEVSIGVDTFPPFALTLDPGVPSTFETSNSFDFGLPEDPVDSIYLYGGAWNGEAAGFTIAQTVLFMYDLEDTVFPDDDSTQSLTPTYDFSQFDWGKIVIDFGDEVTGGTVIIELDTFENLDDCSRARAITTFPADVGMSSWLDLSGDGSRLSFIAQPQSFGYQDLFILDIESGDITQLAIFDPPIRLFGLVSPLNYDGSVITFIGGPDYDNRGVYYIDRNISDTPVFIASGGNRTLIDDAGERILFLADGDLDNDPDSPLANPGGFEQLFLYDRSTGFIRQVTDTMGTSKLRYWISRDGEYAVIASDLDLVPDGNMDGNVELFRLHLDTGVIEQLTDTTGGDVIDDDTRSPHPVDTDGSHLAFVSQEDHTGENPNGYDQVFVINTNTREIEQWTTNPEGAEIIECNAISGDGTTVHFEFRGDPVGENPDNGRTQYFRLTRSSIEQISHFTFGGENTFIAADAAGCRAVFRSNRYPETCLPWDGGQDIYLYDQPCDEPAPSGPGRPDPDGETNDSVLRGYIVAFAANPLGEEIRWDHLSARATVIDYRAMAASEYDATAFQVADPDSAHGEPTGSPGVLELDGFEYVSPPSMLLLNFQAAGSNAFSGSQPVQSSTDLTIHPVSADFSDGGAPVTTKLQIDVWNESEIKLSGAYRCISCWDERLLHNFGNPNHFSVNTLGSNQGKARIDGIASPLCTGSVDAALLGVSTRSLEFEGGSNGASATNLIGMGTEAASIVHTPLDEPPVSPLALGVPSARRSATGTKGSLLILSRVELRWDESGELVQETVVQLTNDHPESVFVQMYFINGDDPTPTEAGWNFVDNMIPLTGNQSIWWTVSDGDPYGLSPFTILDP